MNKDRKRTSGGYLIGVFALGILITQTPVLKAADSAVLLRNLIGVHKVELKTLEQKHRADLKELKRTQDARKKAWDKHEQDERHRFFETHTKGPERREYIQAFFQRQEELLKRFSDERAEKIAEYETQLQALKTEQAAKVNELKESFQKGESTHVDPGK